MVAGTRGEAATPGFDPDHVVYKELRIIGALGVDTDGLPRRARPAGRRHVPLRRPAAAASSASTTSTHLLRSMAGEGDPPPVHGVVRPDLRDQLKEPRCRNPRSRSATTRSSPRRMLEHGHKGGGALPAYLGIELLRFAPGKLWCRATSATSCSRPFGNLHGGVVAAIIDHVTGVVVYPLMPPRHWAATTEIKTNYIARAEGRRARDRVDGARHDQPQRGGARRGLRRGSPRRPPPRAPSRSSPRAS